MNSQDPFIPPQNDTKNGTYINDYKNDQHRTEFSPNGEPSPNHFEDEPRSNLVNEEVGQSDEREPKVGRQVLFAVAISLALFFMIIIFFLFKNLWQGSAILSL